MVKPLSILLPFSVSLYAVLKVAVVHALASKETQRQSITRKLPTIPNPSPCDPSTTTNTVIHTGENSTTLASLASSNPDDGYLVWATTTTSYDNSVYISTKEDSCQGIGFHWKINSDEGTIQIAAAVDIGASSTDGWLAVGFSENGGMRGADVVHFTSASSSIVDAHILDDLVAPTPDEIQDWELIYHTLTDDGYLIFEASRSLKTSDTFDRVFHDDSDIYVTDHRLISAWGSSEFLYYHGSNRVQSSIQLFNGGDGSTGAGLDYQNFLDEMSKRSEGSGVMALSNYRIPERKTTYYEECFENENLFSSAKRWIIGYEFIIKPESKKYMHHMVVYGMSDGCTGDYFQENPIIAWTPGEDFLFFPDSTGMEFGSLFKGLGIQFHVDNKDRDTGVVDTGSGLRIYYTDTPVQNEIGMFQVGDPLVGLIGEEVGDGLTRHTMICPSSCTQSKFVQSDSVTIVKQSLHMHAKGKRIVNQVIREDSVVQESYVDYWDFEQSGATAQANPPFQLKRGDKLKTICYYEADSDTRFGLGSDDEMCMAFILYFPKQDFLSYCGVGFGHYDRACRSVHEGPVSLNDEEEFGRVFGSTSNFVTELPTLSPSELVTSVAQIVPSTQPSLTPNHPTPTGEVCANSSLRFKVNWNDRLITRDCIWISNKATIQRCKLRGVPAACPVTCGGCEICEDSTLRFKVFWNNRKITRDCTWIGNKATIQRCKLPGVSDACRATCGVCS